MRRLLLSVVLVVAILLAPSVRTSIAEHVVHQTAALATSIMAEIPMFASEDSAQKHCPHDIVVWLNTSSGIYHLKGERWFGLTKHGAYNL